MLKTVVALALAAAVLGAGLRSADLWIKSSRVVATPYWVQLGQIEPVNGSGDTQWIVALLQASNESARLNAKAALWSAWTVILATLSALVSLIPG
jgi:hypothetical protein